MTVELHDQHLAIVPLLVGAMKHFVIKFICMEHTSLKRKAWFYIAAWLVILLVAYGWQIWRISQIEGVAASEWDILFDLVCIFPLLLILWMGFFAQFILPVRTFLDRQKIFDRLITYLFGLHGPAMFIRDGQLIRREGEENKKGPGVLWLDSASAAVTRTAVKIKQTLGPGVHFIDNREFVAGTADLHNQTQTIGPKEEEDPFAEKKEDMSPEEYQQIQDRRKMVSALTRDGIEMIPNISVSFRVDTGFPKEGEPGSRFGYRTGSTSKAKENEKKDKEVILKAILGEGVNPNINPDLIRRRVAWNELPASLAVDIWREYVAKFTLDELFNGEHDPISMPPPAPLPPDEEIDPFSRPVQMATNQSVWQNRFAQLLREANVILLKMVTRLEGGPREPKSISQPPKAAKTGTSTKRNNDKVTTLQLINDMLNARLKNPEVPKIDDLRIRGKDNITSPEYELLRRRGLKVLSVGVSNLRFKKEIEDKIRDKWSTSWLKNAEAEEKQILHRQSIAKLTGQEIAIQQYAELLSGDLVRKKPQTEKESLIALLLRTRKILTNLMRLHPAITNTDELREEMEEQRQSLEDILRWAEADQ